MNPTIDTIPDFIPDDQADQFFGSAPVDTPDFIPDDDADKFFGGSADEKVVSTILEEYKKKKAKEDAIKALSPNIEDVPLLGNVYKSAEGGVQKIAKGGKNVEEGVRSGKLTQVGRGLLQGASGALETFFSPITGAVQTLGNAPGVKQTVEATNKYVVKPTANVLSESKTLQKFVQNNPNVEEVTGDIINVGSAFIGGKKAPVIKGALNEGVEMGAKVKNVATNVINRKALEMTTVSERKMLDDMLSKYQKGVKPNIPGKTTPKQVTAYKEDALSAIDSIKNNKDNLKFLDENGETITGKLPESLQEFSDALEQTKNDIFKKYDDLAQKTNEEGIKIKFDPVVTELDTIIGSKSLKLTHPETVDYAKKIQSRYRQTGELDPVTLQDVIKNYNEDLKAFYRSPNPDTVSKMMVNQLVVNLLRESLDNAVTKMTGTKYATLKRQYGALKSIEKDVVKANLRDARKNQKGLIDFTDVLSGGQVVSGIASFNPALVASGIAQKSIASYIKFLNNPNRSVKLLFEKTDKLARIQQKAENLKLKINTNPTTKKGMVKLSKKYTRADGSPISLEAEKWIDENVGKYQSKKYISADLEKLQRANPDVYKEVVEYINSDRFANKKDSSLGERVQMKQEDINNSVNRHIGEAFQILNDPDMAKMIKEDPKGLIDQTYKNILMGLEKDAPAEAKIVSKIDVDKIESVAQLGSEIEKALKKKDGFIDRIVKKITDAK